MNPGLSDYTSSISAVVRNMLDQCYEKNNIMELSFKIYLAKTVHFRIFLGFDRLNRCNDNLYIEMLLIIYRLRLIRLRFP